MRKLFKKMLNVRGIKFVISEKKQLSWKILNIIKCFAVLLRIAKINV